MTLATALVLGLAAMITGLILTYIQKKRTENQVKAELRSNVRVAEIMQMKEELQKLHKETTTQTDSYKKAREEYAKKYHSKSKPPPNSSDSNS